MAAGTVKSGDIEGALIVVDVGGNAGKTAAALGVVLIDPTTGNAYLAGSGGGGGGGDASQAKQDTGNASLASIDTKASNIALMSAKLPATLGAKATAAAMAVSLATDDAQIGTKVTAITALAAGGTGLIGWLSQVWERLNVLAGMGTLAAGTNRSGTVTAGGTAQVLAAANTARRSLSGQNISAGDLWINETGGTAAVSTAGSYRIPPGSSFEINTNQAVSIIGATTAQAFTATEI